MALSAISINHVNLDFNTTGGTDFLRGNVQDNIRVEINFSTPNPIQEVEVKLGTLNNFTNIYPTSGSFKIPDSYFNNANTGDIQSWRGAVGVLNPNNVKRWNEGLVRLLDNGGNSYTIVALIKLKPLLLFSDISNGVLDSSLSPYAGIKALKTIFEVNAFDVLGTTTPDHTSVDNDLSAVIKNGATGYLNEYLNGNAPIYSVTGYQESDNSFRALMRRNSGAFAVTDKVVLKFQRVTNEFNLDLDLDENLLYFEFSCLADGILTPISDDRIENVTASIIGADLQIVVNYNANFFYGVSNYAITATVGVSGTAESTHERTTSLIRFKSFAYPFSEDLFEIRPVEGIEKAIFYNQIGTSINNLSDNVEGYPEDVQLLKFNFGIKRAVYSFDEATLTNLTIKISDDNGTFQSRSFVASQNLNQSRGLYLPSADEFNIVSLDIIDEEAYIDNTALKVINQYTLQRFDSGNFITDGFAVGDSLTITGDISIGANITALTTTVMTIDTPIDIQYVGKFWTLNINGTDYTNFPATGVFNYKLYNVTYPFMILPNWVTKVGLKLEIEMAVSQVMPDGVIESDTFVYKVSDFIIYNYGENNTIDTSIVGSVQLSDESGAQLSTGIFDDINTKMVSTFVQVNLSNFLNSAVAYNNINLLAGSEQTNQYFSNTNENKAGAFIGDFATLASPSVNNLELTSTLDYNQLLDIDYRLSSRLYIPIYRFIFFTNIDSSVNTFTPSINGTFVNPKYTFKDESEVLGSNISTSANGLDGTVQPVIFTADSWSNLSALTFTLDRIVGVLDLSSFNYNMASSFILAIEINAIEEIILPSTNNSVVAIRLNSSSALSHIDLTPLSDNLDGVLSAFSCPLLTSVTLATNANTMTQIAFHNCDLSEFDLSGWTAFCEKASFSLSLYNNSFSEQVVDEILIYTDSIATNAFAGRSILLQGNSAPSASGIVAKNSLISKGFTVTTA